MAKKFVMGKKYTVLVVDGERVGNTRVVRLAIQKLLGYYAIVINCARSEFTDVLDGMADYEGGLMYLHVPLDASGGLRALRRDLELSKDERFKRITSASELFKLVPHDNGFEQYMREDGVVNAPVS